MHYITNLEGHNVKLIPLDLNHVEALYNCSRDDEIWEHFVTKVDSLASMSQLCTMRWLKRRVGINFRLSLLTSKLRKL